MTCRCLHAITVFYNIVHVPSSSIEVSDGQSIDTAWNCHHNTCEEQHRLCVQSGSFMIQEACRGASFPPSPNNSNHANMQRTITRTILFLALLGLCHAATNPLVIKGRKFFDSVTKNQFYIKGVDYQPSADPIADITGLQRDIPYMKQLGINTIRCYQTDYTLSHDQGMQLLSDNGIYVILDLSDPHFSIESLSPAWSTTNFNFMRLKAGVFAGYTNTLGYIIANEVVLPPGSTPAAAYVKAATRDVKMWLKSQNHTKPVGYAAADVDENVDMQNFMDCNSADESADFYGVNIYRWCGNSTFEGSGYQTFVNQWANYRVPLIFSEFGCNTAGYRSFTEIGAMYSSQMTDVLSGGLVYEWHQEDNNYGLVDIVSSTQLNVRADFSNLQYQYSQINPTIANYDSYTPAAASLSNCPAVSSSWAAVSSPLPPVPNVNKCACMWDQLTCRVNTNVFSPVTTPTSARNAVGNTFNSICSKNPSLCAPVKSTATTGTYGDYSDCNAFERVSYIIDQVHQQNGNCSYTDLPTEVVASPRTPAATDCRQQANAFPYNPKDSSSGNGNPYCGGNNLPCGQDCYDPTVYCCQNHQLLQNSQCDPNQPTETWTYIPTSSSPAVTPTSSSSASPSSSVTSPSSTSPVATRTQGGNTNGGNVATGADSTQSTPTSIGATQVQDRSSANAFSCGVAVISGIFAVAVGHYRRSHSRWYCDLLLYCIRSVENGLESVPLQANKPSVYLKPSIRVYLSILWKVSAIIGPASFRVSKLRVGPSVRIYTALPRPKPVQHARRMVDTRTKMEELNRSFSFEMTAKEIETLNKKKKEVKLQLQQQSARY
ncbi:1,3-beta-glucanosyltransferase gel3 [Planoprotostelium fungivorum]|uniref:1,3-beta-glucanosyltransferase gel3 n=1 Tax=Planoprotostelium fungivorum TaxID=1890364 RepID=A0A2P6N396_9EUKA|nr:1,3-beta-glucanosyltransferase gel3 [Planoprotostelium fungivorum]